MCPKKPVSHIALQRISCRLFFQSFFPSLVDPCTPDTTPAIHAKDEGSRKACTTPATPLTAKQRANRSLRTGNSIAAKQHASTTHSITESSETTAKVITSTRRKSTDGMKVDEKAISERWDSIKAEERRKLRSAGAKSADVTLMYEISTRRKSQNLPPIRVNGPGHSLSRAISDSIVSQNR